MPTPAMPLSTSRWLLALTLSFLCDVLAQVPNRPPTWQMNQSTIIMPCNGSGFTDPQSTAGWAVVDFDWSNSKGMGNASGWAKHKPMDADEQLLAQVQMTAAASPGTTVWVYRCECPWVGGSANR